jgi:hypothetical protein
MDDGTNTGNDSKMGTKVRQKEVRKQLINYDSISDSLKTGVKYSRAHQII